MPNTLATPRPEAGRDRARSLGVDSGDRRGERRKANNAFSAADKIRCASKAAGAHHSAKRAVREARNENGAVRAQPSHWLNQTPRAARPCAA
jgi:hypothetical protein